MHLDGQLEKQAENRKIEWEFAHKSHTSRNEITAFRDLVHKHPQEMTPTQLSGVFFKSDGSTTSKHTFGSQ